MSNNDMQQPEGALLERATAARGFSARQAATRAGLSDARWRQIVNGYQSVSAGNKVPVRGPAETIARMAQAVGVSADQLRTAGRDDAADLLLTLVGMQTENEWHQMGTALDRLVGIREQLEAVIAELTESLASERRRA